MQEAENEFHVYFIFNFYYIYLEHMYASVRVSMYGVCRCGYHNAYVDVRRQLSELVIIHRVYFRGQNRVVSVGLIAGAWIVSEKRNLSGKYPTEAVRSLKESQSQNLLQK